MSPAAIVLGACSPSLCPHQPQGTSFACLVFPTDPFPSKCFMRFNWKDCFHSSCSANVHSLKLGFVALAGHQATVQGSCEAECARSCSSGPRTHFQGRSLCLLPSRGRDVPVGVSTEVVDLPTLTLFTKWGCPCPRSVSTTRPLPQTVRPHVREPLPQRSPATCCPSTLRTCVDLAPSGPAAGEPSGCVAAPVVWGGSLGTDLAGFWVPLGVL